ncbi:hypothetical protein [Rhodopirellula sallentina]|nr:hypothetical protein [Rhodopirellula sallentina]
MKYALLSMSLMIHVGCSQKTPVNERPAQIDNLQSSVDNSHDHSVAGHAHGAGPHDGTIVDWGGGKYHVEFTVDHDKQEGTAYILGPDEKTPTPITAEEIQLAITDPAMEVTLKAAPQEGDPEGSASRYIGNHEKLGVVQEYAGTITGLIDDTPYSGDFAEVAHDH